MAGVWKRLRMVSNDELCLQWCWKFSASRNVTNLLPSWNLQFAILSTLFQRYFKHAVHTFRQQSISSGLTGFWFSAWTLCASKILIRLVLRARCVHVKPRLTWADNPPTSSDELQDACLQKPPWCDAKSQQSLYTYHEWFVVSAVIATNFYRGTQSQTFTSAAVSRKLQATELVLSLRTNVALIWAKLRDEGCCVWWPLAGRIADEFRIHDEYEDNVMKFEGCSVYCNTTLSKVIRQLVKIMSVRACIWCHWCCRLLLCTFQSWQIFHFSKLN
jgi:hypothetical protein